MSVRARSWRSRQDLPVASALNPRPWILRSGPKLSTSRRISGGCPGAGADPETGRRGMGRRGARSRCSRAEASVARRRALRLPGLRDRRRQRRTGRDLEERTTGGSVTERTHGDPRSRVSPDSLRYSSSRQQIVGACVLALAGSPLPPSSTGSAQATGPTDTGLPFEANPAPTLRGRLAASGRRRRERRRSRIRACPCRLETVRMVPC